MKMKKFELTSYFVINAFGTKLFRVRALVDFGTVHAGDMGGYVESEKNLSQEGNAWVSGYAKVSGYATVSDDAWVSGYAKVSGNATVSGNAKVSGNATVRDNATVSGNADYATVKGFGRAFRTTTFFRCNDEKIRVQCGCFLGDLNEFRAIVKRTHGDGKMAKEYLAIADLMEMHFGDERNE